MTHSERKFVSILVFSCSCTSWKENLTKINSFLVWTVLLTSYEVRMKWNFCLHFCSKILKSMILWFVIFEFGLWKSSHELFLPLPSWPIRGKNVPLSARGQNMQIRGAVDVTRCVKPSSHHSSWEKQAKEWEVFRLVASLGQSLNSKIMNQCNID